MRSKVGRGAKSIRSPKSVRSPKSRRLLSAALLGEVPDKVSGWLLGVLPPALEQREVNLPPEMGDPVKLARLVRRMLIARQLVELGFGVRSIEDVDLWLDDWMQEAFSMETASSFDRWVCWWWQTEVGNVRSFWHADLLEVAKRLVSKGAESYFRTMVHDAILRRIRREFSEVSGETWSLVLENARSGAPYAVPFQGRILYGAAGGVGPRLPLWLIHVSSDCPELFVEALDPRQRVVWCWRFGAQLSPESDPRLSTLVHQYNSAIKVKTPISMLASSLQARHVRMSGAYGSFVPFPVVGGQLGVRVVTHDRGESVSLYESGDPFLEACRRVHLLRFLFEGKPLPSQLAIQLTPSPTCDILPLLNRTRPSDLCEGVELAATNLQVWEFHETPYLHMSRSYRADPRPFHLIDYVRVRCHDLSQLLMALYNHSWSWYSHWCSCKEAEGGSEVEVEDWVDEWAEKLPAALDTVGGKMVEIGLLALRQFHDTVGMTHNDAALKNMFVCEATHGSEVLEIDPSLFPPGEHEVVRLTARLGDLDLVATDHALFPSIKGPQWLADYASFLFMVLTELEFMAPRSRFLIGFRQRVAKTMLALRPHLTTHHSAETYVSNMWKSLTTFSQADPESHPEVSIIAEDRGQTSLFASWSARVLADKHPTTPELANHLVHRAWCRSRADLLHSEGTDTLETTSK